MKLKYILPSACLILSMAACHENQKPVDMTGHTAKKDSSRYEVGSVVEMPLSSYVPEAYVDKVDLKHQVSFTFNSMPGKENKANISRTANALSSMRSEAIEIDVNNSSQELKPGMYAEVKVPLLSGAKSLLVPSHAIVRSTERQYIIKVVDGKAHFVDIKEGLKANEQTEIFGDISKDDAVVLHATDEIREGTVIR